MSQQSTVSKRQAHERLESLWIRARKALWFRKQYGLQLDTLCFKDTEGNQYPLKISLSRSTSPAPPTTLQQTPGSTLLLHHKPLVFWHLPHHKSLVLPTPPQQEPLVLPLLHHHKPQLPCHLPIGHLARPQWLNYMGHHHWAIGPQHNANGCNSTPCQTVKRREWKQYSSWWISLLWMIHLYMSWACW